jgi:hypothetical protein
MNLIAALVLAAALQAPTTPTSKVETTAPTSTEQFAIGAVRSEFQKAWSDLRAISDDIAKNHPGYHFNSDTGLIEKNPEVVAPLPVKK